ncbi:MAG TPA: BTAD domain-containing putative transcriptional regulator [Micromonosporaceae bacterium]|nr:BTAD domain-containing putative transcriptional regulator [Micromonosporaceae bacterium]
MDLQYRILGPIEVWCGSHQVALGGPRQRLVLAVLLIHANQVVSMDRLVDEIWPERPPPSALANVRTYVAGLRSALPSRNGSGPITSRPGGYLLNVGSEELDLTLYESLVATSAAARSRNDLPAEVAALERAAALWRGTPLADVPSSPRVAAVRAYLEEQQAALVEERARALIDLGRYGEAAAVLRRHVAIYPLRERGHYLLVLALHRNGSPGDALAAYRAARETLLRELGVEPGPELARLHREILTDEAQHPSDPGEVSAGSPVRGAPPVPAQLPMDVRGFVGRVAELRRLDALVRDAPAPAGDGAPAGSGDEAHAAVVIAAITGPAGVGKTALAVHWAHRIAHRFPDGQLYLNLRGFDPSNSTMSPAEAVRVFLEALQVPSARVPTTFDAQVGLYRSLLAGKRVLVVLDNARDADQVRPLLPGAPGCVVVVTSRNRLTSLVAAEGAHSIMLDLLTAAEARSLLSHRLGERAVRAEPEAVEDIVTSCDRLPLALAVVAANAAAHAGRPLADLAARLRQGGDNLDAFSAGDPSTDLRAVFSWSYHSLSREAARVFRLLGLHPGSDFGAASVASLAGVAAARARALLAELVRAHLVVEVPGDRFAFHDLLRAYAAELVNTVDEPGDREAASLRILDHYLHTAHAAAMRMRPGRIPIELRPASPGASPETFDQRSDAQTWFATERGQLTAAVDLAARIGRATHAWQLAWAIEDYLDFAGHWDDLRLVHASAVRATEQAGDRAGQASAHSGLGRAYTRLGEFDRAHEHMRVASDLYAELGEYARQAAVLRNIGVMLCSQQGRHAEALAYGERALKVLPADCMPEERAYVLSALGWFHAQVGNHHRALDYCRSALAVPGVSDPGFRGSVMDILGNVHHRLGDYQEAIASYRQAIEVYNSLGIALYKAKSLAWLGDAYHSAGTTASAVRAWEQAIQIFEQLDPPEADRLRTRIVEVTSEVARHA